MIQQGEKGWEDMVPKYIQQQIKNRKLFGYQDYGYLQTCLLIYYLLSKIITTIIVYFWNFFARKIILFNKEIA